ncbi:WASH complex subunit 1 [Agrilus planipennis]|uniref:WASH complex subunit 1 n=1 Tax=Agrilus planipennis TaxID=224129 RepID=A0A1W4WAS5_AGRPL|nr:WASH complex subunit 1 [Agrilus planipennis]
MNCNYNVPVIPPNLRREETIVQIADTLEYLSNVTNDIFNRINNRIESNTRKLASIQERVNIADSKVEKLAGEKKAIQIFSSSKYPAANLNQKYISIFGKDDKIQPKHTKFKYKETVNTKEEPSDRLEYYHVKSKNTPADYETKGLGKIPEDIEFFTDLLLYNTGKNLYQDYITLDPLENSEIPKQNNQSYKSNIEDAPVSITDQTTLRSSDEDSYFYSPDLGEVPSLEVPLDLPDLPGIADDLRYEAAEESFGIAPSILTPSDLKRLPDTNITHIDNFENHTIDKTNSDLSEVDTIQDKPLPEIKKEVKPQPQVDVFNKVVDPPQQNIDINIKSEVDNNVPEKTETPETNISTNKKQDIEVAKSKMKLDLPISNDNAHATLMEAIRKTGGIQNAKLRPISPKTSDVSKTGGDLMADLHAKLSLRRKGISGAKSAENAPIDATSTLARMAELIPPPALVSSSGGETDDTDDDDWDD